jgi:glycosyltransferase involved in cell wall biosynthesis
MAARIAFYAPMKPPDHAIASGDREIARLMASALEAAGFEVEIASRFISYQKRPDAGRLRTLEDEGEAEAARIIEDVRAGRRAAPDLWFTYHPYCKAPDRIGPQVARALSIPYVTAEACRTRQGSGADWESGRMAVQEAVRLADINFCLKPSDEAYLRSILPDMKSTVALMPFLDADAIRADATSIDPTPFFARQAPLIVAVGMMRPGAKTQSYRLLAESLSDLADRPWNLAVIGDGPERGNVEAMFGFASKEVPVGGARSAAGGTPLWPAKGRIRFTGALPHADVLGWMRAADLLAWPGIGEAIGMVYLEAAACRLPVAACDVANVATVVSDGETGLLAGQAETAAYREVLSRLLSDEALRRRLGDGGSEKTGRDHGIGGAAATLKTAIEPLLRRSMRPAALAR